MGNLVLVRRRGRERRGRAIRLREPPANDRGGSCGRVHQRCSRVGGSFGVAEERTEVESAWGPIIVGDEGRNWRGILQACADREIDVLFLIGVDPLRDYPDSALALARWRTSGTRWSSRWSSDPSRRTRTHPSPAAFLEKDGHVTTWRDATSAYDRSAALPASRSRTGRSSRALRSRPAATSASNA